MLARASFVVERFLGRLLAGSICLLDHVLGFLWQITLFYLNYDLSWPEQGPAWS